MANKSEKIIASSCLDCLYRAEKELKSVVEMFSELETIRPADSFLFGLVRGLQQHMIYVMNVISDADKQNKPSPKTKQLSPELQKE